jgi:hypothetical protein
VPGGPAGGGGDNSNPDSESDISLCIGGGDNSNPDILVYREGGWWCGPYYPRDCVGMLFYFLFQGGVQNLIFVTKWVADGASGCETTAVLHRISTQIQWDQFWTLKQKKSKLVIACPSSPGYPLSSSIILSCER